MVKYITSSLKLHLFFARIMKEHGLFLEAGFPAKYKNYIDEAEWYKNAFENFLLDIVKISNGIVEPKIINSGEFVTDHTLKAEEKTEELTGIAINKNITMMENNMRYGNNFERQNVTQLTIKQLNNKAINLLDGLINLKQRILNDMLSCDVYAAYYPLLVEHIMREAKLYRYYIIALENGQDIENEDMRHVELFWNQIMMEHALFIRGLLDPTENDLINTAENFAEEYKQLLEEATRMTDATMENITSKTIKETQKYAEFKNAGTVGLENCQIKSFIVPLLADHVLREANHYLRILRKSS